ncbi:TerC family protein [Effusibacillus dendaii]|uniref:Membrane protein n=1 Tax=Effusibacillus dendaii TaxID=2743772 RepID=A0A7I8DD00_9BACL|nr:TerC family protein [Effusibacillus dendaii]BCJ88068.1 membrane protein [Effusibacillus dendaii]
MVLVFLASLLKIIIINLVLSGDNAIVIALACRNLQEDQRKKAVWYGTLGAVILRILLTFVVVEILKIPFLMVIGGALLIWIAFKLLLSKEEEQEVKARDNLWGAVRTVIMADLIMSLDNVLAVAAAAEGSVLLLAIGIAISIPLIVWGSTLILKMMDRFPFILYIGAGILAYTAGQMILDDHWVYRAVKEIPGIHYILPAVTAVLVLLLAYALNKRQVDGVKQKQAENI